LIESGVDLTLVQRLLGQNTRLSRNKNLFGPSFYSCAESYFASAIIFFGISLF